MSEDGAPGAPPTPNRIRMSAEKACFFGGLCATGRQERSSGFPKPSRRTFVQDDPRGVECPIWLGLPGGFKAHVGSERSGAFERRLKKGKPTAEPRHSAVQSGEPW